MTKQKLSKPQRRAIERMERTPSVTWWTPATLKCGRSTIYALVRRGILESHLKGHDEASWLWRLVPEAERVPVPDDEGIPF